MKLESVGGVGRSSEVGSGNKNFGMGIGVGRVRGARRRSFFGAVMCCACGVLVASGLSRAETVTADFQLLTSSNATGVKPSASAPTNGDWLVFTADDASGSNTAGALSHNFVDPPPIGGSAFAFGVSLTGNLTMQFTGTGSSWAMSVTQLSFNGEAAPSVSMSQHLLSGNNSGNWSASKSAAWALEYDLSFYFDSNQKSTTQDLIFYNKTQTGYLLPVSELTVAGLTGLSLNDPAGFFSGNFTDYLLNEIQPRLPGNATYLLFTQMDKLNPDFAESGLPVTTSSLIGNTLIAYTTVAAIPEPSSLALLALASGVVALAWRRRSRASIG